MCLEAVCTNDECFMPWKAVPSLVAPRPIGEATCGTGLAGGAACVENFECSSWTCNAGKCNSVLYQLVDKGLCNGGTSG